MCGHFWRRSLTHEITHELNPRVWPREWTTRTNFEKNPGDPRVPRDLAHSCKNAKQAVLIFVSKYELLGQKSSLVSQNRLGENAFITHPPA